MLQVELIREECNKNIDKMASEIEKMEKVLKLLWQSIHSVSGVFSLIAMWV